MSPRRVEADLFVATGPRAWISPTTRPVLHEIEVVRFTLGGHGGAVDEQVQAVDLNAPEADLQRRRLDDVARRGAQGDFERAAVGCCSADHGATPGTEVQSVTTLSSGGRSNAASAPTLQAPGRDGSIPAATLERAARLGR